MNQKSLRCLITGGAGFIGSHLAEELVNQGHKVTILDNLYNGKQSYHNKLFNKIPFLKTSVIDEEVIDVLVSNHDVIFHLSAILGVKSTMDKSVELMETNIDGTRNILRSALKYDRKVVFASTSEVYGKAAPPFVEDGDRLYGSTDKLRWCYAVSKTLEETLCLGYGLKGLRVTVVRYFNIYGPRAKEGPYAGVIPRFISAALKGEPIPVYGDGTQTRCFTFISDAVEATIRALDEKCNNEIINIGSQSEINILDLAKLIRNLTSTSSPIVHVPFEEVYPLGFEEIPNRFPDITKMSQLLTFTPKVSFTEGLNETIDWFKNNE
ncbi:NAD-dependent epimerase/dehydratase family protein [Robertmurraya sp. FSL R5-0851]|uniref:NAD-dependent epimerase/dehydratase family protein n=1 Tax=Robertmurraya sp. FSL R5-0851 TaxID=2921584 RepID=UPI0030F5271F